MGSSAPRIGITTYGRENGRFSLPVEYVDSVRRAGGIPLLLPPGGERLGDWFHGIDALILALFDALDAIVLTGGGDLDPSTYGGVADSECVRGRRGARPDRAPASFATCLVESDLPGMSASAAARRCINVALGGTLIEHLPEEATANGQLVAHRRPAARADQARTASTSRTGPVTLARAARPPSSSTPISLAPPGDPQTSVEGLARRRTRPRWSDRSRARYVRTTPGSSPCSGTPS